MAFITLSIKEPKNNAVFIGKEPVIEFKWEQAPLPEGLKDKNASLYYRWYASSIARISADNKILGYSIHENALTNPDEVITHTLGIGSHVITFAVSDRQGETVEDFKLIQHGGVTGGSIGENPCVVHVFKANIISPLDGDTVSRNSLILKAEVPSAWGSDDYHKYNRLSYRWKLEPLREPINRPTFDFNKLDKDKLKFDKKDITVSFMPLLPATATGQYQITLFVMDKDKPEINHTDSIVITL